MVKNFLLIESRDAFGADGAGFCGATGVRAGARRRRGGVLLVQNGVLPARAGARAPQLAHLAAAGVAVLADDFSLRERGIAADRLGAGVQAVPLDIVIDRLIDGWQVVWH